MSSWPIGFDPDNPGDLYVPTISDEALTEIGRAMVNWGILECQLDTLIGAVYHLDSTFVLTIASGLNTKAKVEILRSAIDMLREPLGEEFATEADAILCEIPTLSSGVRNIIAHGQLTQHPDGYPVFFRHSARKRLEFTHYPAGAEEWREQAEQIIDFASALWDLVPHIVKVVRDLTPEDYDRICISR